MAGGTWTNGAADRDLGTNGNWSSGTAPGANDNMFFTSDFSSANSSPNAGMADLTAVDVNLIEITDGYNQVIGLTGARMDISADKVNHFGQNTLYYVDGGGTTDHILVHQSRNPVLSGGAPVTALELAGNKTVNLSVRRGLASVVASTTVDSILLGQHGLNTPEARLTIGSGCTIASAKNFGGVCTECASAITTLEMFGGKWTQSTVVLATIWVYPGAHITLTVAGTYTTIYHLGGVIDMRQGGAKVITNYYQMFDHFDEQNVVLGYRPGSFSQVTVTNAL